MESYLFTTATNLLRDRQRRRAARASEAHDTYEDDLHGSARETHTPERAASASQALEQLVEALHELPERTRNLWLLYHRAGLQYVRTWRSSHDRGVMLSIQ
jgi:RNA polymerase sigma-70 factor (ECF subfamily)